jgi:peptidyl-prolyl cis-trans isomerase A (cyclophilin A)
MLCVVSLAIAAFPHATHAQAPAEARISIGPNQRASGADTLNRNEGWIAASLTNPNVLVAVSHMATQGCTTMVSTDGGNLWRTVTLPKQNDCFDPMVTASPDGSIYILHTGRTPTSPRSGTGQRQEAPVRIFTSTDDAKTWRGPAEMRTPLVPDHPRMAADHSNGPHRGRLYVAWNEVSDGLMIDRYHIFLHYSDDRGSTFTEPILLETDSGGKLVTTEPIVFSDGELLVTYYQYFQPLSSRKNERQPFYLLRSTDGAQTFGEPEKVLEVGISAWPLLKADFQSAFTLPIITVDAGATSPYRDRLYVVWDDVSSGESNIWFTSSSDRGRTWTPRKQINDNPPRAPGSPVDFRMTPVVAVNPDGVIGIAWYDRREDPTRRCWKKYFAASLDGGQTFTRNVPVSSQPSCPLPDMAPTVTVKNATPDTVLPSADSVQKLIDLRRFGDADRLNLALEQRAADQAIQGAQFRLSFDRGRSVWPGHYTGLAADTTGAFHALWADRRSGYQQMYSAKIEVSRGPEPALPELRDTTVTTLVEVHAVQTAFDEATGLSTLVLQLRNASNRTIYGPLHLRVSRIVAGSAGNGRVIEDADNGRNGNGAVWDFSSLLGSGNRFVPGMVTEAREVKIRTRADDGLDLVFQFEILGRVALDDTGNARDNGSGAESQRIMLVTEMGEIEIELDSAHAPVTVTNFLRYVDSAFFDGGRFFRVVRANNQPNDSIRIEVIQGGVAQERARQGFGAIPLERTSITGLRHRDGTISMARAGPETATSSFFICIGDQPSLDFGGMRNPDGQGFAAFGQVVRGMDVVRRIHQGEVNGQNLVNPVRIVSARRL